MTAARLCRPRCLPLRQRNCSLAGCARAVYGWLRGRQLTSCEGGRPEGGGAAIHNGTSPCEGGLSFCSSTAPDVRGVSPPAHIGDRCCLDPTTSRFAVCIMSSVGCSHRLTPRNIPQSNRFVWSPQLFVLSGGRFPYGVPQSVTRCAASPQQCAHPYTHVFPA